MPAKTTITINHEQPLDLAPYDPTTQVVVAGQLMQSVLGGMREGDIKIESVETKAPAKK